MPIKKIVKTKRIPVNKKPSSKDTTAHVIPLMLYRRIAFVFVVLVAAVLFVVVYLATMQAVIRVTTVPTEISTDFIVKTVDVAVKDGEVQGEIHSGTLGRKKVITPSGGISEQVPAQAKGRVVITNTLSTSQPLVATTRLLSSDGVLFRLSSGVTVPAKGSVEVDVYADLKGASGNIGPAQFTIPGLNEAKQQMITASSTDPMTGGVEYISVLSQAQIDEAAETFKSELLADAQMMLREQKAHDYTGEAFFTEEKSRKTDAKDGDEVGSFEIEMEVSVTGVFYDEEALKKITLRKLSANLGQGQEFVDYGEDTRVVVVQQVNTQQGESSIHVSQTARALTSRASQALEVDRFVGMTENEVRDLLIKEGVATEVDVQFFPFWVRTVPRLQDHIYVELR